MTEITIDRKAEVFALCQQIFPEWTLRNAADFEFDDPKGFSTFTMGVRARCRVDPPAVLYRRLEGKENAILEFETEKEVFLTLGANDIAAHCHYYGHDCRVEAFYQGRTLTPDDLVVPDNLRQIADQLYRFHQLRPSSLPPQGFFELLHSKWGKLAKQVLETGMDKFPPNERMMCEELREIYSADTFDKVKKCLPVGDLTFCHNDTYHGNIMKLDSGEIKLLDFEFSCLNHKAYDFSNLFAETVMRHQQADYPFFKIAEPDFSQHEIGLLINYYLDNHQFENSADRKHEFKKLLADTNTMLMMSDYKYAMAALPLALDPIQKIRFIPYAHQRFTKFLAAYDRHVAGLS
ncbi:MAG: phosphotransferase [Gammaproteobacteria bacterium]|nr:phosphotransferase [Gammaproteobacteria bacterium]